MKILFLHLCDLHINEKSNVTAKIDKINDAVKSLYPVDKCVLICSGDLASTGRENEYKSVKQFFGGMLAKLGETTNQFIEFYLVPGNHDMIFEKDSRKFDDILGYYKQKIVDAKFELELDSQENFFNYARSKKCFMKNRVIDSRIRTYDGFKVQYNLLNTAPFSTLKPDDKQIHHLPNEYMYSLIKKDDADLCVTIMHHSPEWFNSDAKDSLEKIFRTNSDIVFHGHEHIAKTTQSEDYLLSKGGLFSDEIKHTSTFSVLIFDTESYECDEITYEWNLELFMFTKGKALKKCTLNLKKNRMMPNNDFMYFLYQDEQKISQSFLEYFVFPDLSYDIGKKKDVKFLSEKCFWDELEKHKIVNLSGKSKSGKTTLLKYIYSQCIDKGLYPIYLSSDECPQKTWKENIINMLFNRQYDTNVSLFEQYEQLDFVKKILIIDNLDSIRIDKNELLNFFAEQFGSIVFTSHEWLDVDIISAARRKLMDSKSCLNLKIEDFYKEKRTALIRNIVKVSKSSLLEDVDYIIEVIDTLVIRKNILFELSPAHIVQYLKYFMRKERDDRRGEAVFNIVFETNLRISILDISGEKYLEHCMVVLEEIAFRIHTNRRDKISYMHIIELIDELNKKRDLSINIDKCFNIIKTANIIKTSDKDNMCEFSNRNFLAYFIARRLNRLIEKNGYNIPELEYVFKNICFGINDNILLFLSFIRDNTNFSLMICEMLESMLAEYEELDFDKNNIPFIKNQGFEPTQVPTHQDKIEHEKSIDISERRFRKKELSEIKYKQIYDYDESSADNFINKMVAAIKYLEVISKSLISHFVNLESQEKQKIVELMYNAPNRILYRLLKELNYSEIVDELKHLSDSVDNTSQIKRKDIETIVTQVITMLVLGIYDLVACYGANSDTLRLLNAVEMKNSNYKVQNLIMLENGGTSIEFVDSAIKLNNDANDVFITNLIRLIANKHLLTREVDYKIIDRLTNTIFQQTAKKQLLLTSRSGRRKKINK